MCAQEYNEWFLRNRDRIINSWHNQSGAVIFEVPYLIPQISGDLSLYVKPQHTFFIWGQYHCWSDIRPDILRGSYDNKNWYKVSGTTDHWVMNIS